MSRFGGNPRDFFDAVYRDVPPWDVGGAQPALLDLFAAYPPTGPVLDVGCGSGDLALALARQGIEVVGVDFVPSAIEQARAKAHQLPDTERARVTFEVGDASRPAGLGRRVGAVVDSGFLHVLDPVQTLRFVEDLALTLLPGGRYYLLAFATEFDIPNTPRRITPDEVRSRFTPAAGWRILELREAAFQSRIAPVPATAACVELSGAAG